MKSDQEILKTFSLGIDKNGIIILVFHEPVPEPEINTRQAELIESSLINILDNGPKKSFSMLIDLTNAGNETNIPSHTRDIYTKSPAFKRVYKIAVITHSLLIKVLTSTLSVAGGKFESVKIFDGKQEALNWLKK